MEHIHVTLRLHVIDVERLGVGSPADEFVSRPGVHHVTAQVAHPADRATFECAGDGRYVFARAGDGEDVKTARVQILGERARFDIKPLAGHHVSDGGGRGQFG